MPIEYTLPCAQCKGGEFRNMSFMSPGYSFAILWAFHISMTLRNYAKGCIWNGKSPIFSDLEQVHAPYLELQWPHHGPFLANTNPQLGTQPWNFGPPMPADRTSCGQMTRGRQCKLQPERCCSADDFFTTGIFQGELHGFRWCSHCHADRSRPVRDFSPGYGPPTDLQVMVMVEPSLS